MFRFIAEILVRSKIKQESSERKKAFLEWEKIEKVAIILEQEDGWNKNEIDKFISDTQKYVEVFYLEPRSKQATYADWHCFTKKDRSLTGLPKTHVTDLLKNKSFDLVINTCEESNLFAIYLSVSIKAPLHCGTADFYNEKDLVVKRLENQKLLNYLNNVLIYLKMIKS